MKFAAQAKKSKEKQVKPQHITENEIRAFNEAVRENYRLAIKEIKEQNKHVANRKTFKYDLGEDTDSDENEGGLYGLHDVDLGESIGSEKNYAQKDLYNFMVIGENKISKCTVNFSIFSYGASPTKKE